jgi:ATP-dependent helicase/nuclease subunit A
MALELSPKLTSAQQAAITARGNVLVVAGAGTGKTETLVTRCLDCLLDARHPATMDQVLVVTYTEAAAAELRRRLRQAIEKEAQANPGQTVLAENLALFDTAHIGTIHSFCLKLLRQHFYELELDPNLTVLPIEEAKLLAAEKLNELFSRCYAEEIPMARAAQALIKNQGGGNDETIRALILKIHDYTQTLPSPEAWFREQTEIWDQAAPEEWRGFLHEAFAALKEDGLRFLAAHSESNPIARKSGDLLRELGAETTPAATAQALETIRDLGRNPPTGKKGLWVTPLASFFEDVEFVLSLIAKDQPSDPLAQDWEWVRDHALCLLKLAQDFTRSFTEAKRQLGGVDFRDLEQYALRLLWDASTGLATPLARDWQSQLKYIFIDEYQDINAAQDKILASLSRSEQIANRFLVGDLKQSIYRFRLANLRIFQNYIHTWRKAAATVIPLVDNFRSRPGILNFVNSFFEQVMCPEVGGIEYDDTARLRYGLPAAKSAAEHSDEIKEPCVEIILRVKAKKPNSHETEEKEAASDWSEIQDAEKEARMAARALAELRASKFLILDKETKALRPVDWKDMALLLRSPGSKAEHYAKAFQKLNVPLRVERSMFYETIEISDILSILTILDNPFQDVPLLAVLRSPLVGLTLDELVDIRLAATREDFWTALSRWHESASAMASKGELAEGNRLALSKTTLFLDRFARWRRLARQSSLSQCLNAILEETSYADWLLTLPQGELRCARVKRLATLAREFDHFQRQGLFRFLRFVEAQQDADTEPEIGAASSENAVRLISIHQSKGLEFPVVLLADLSKLFNESDLKADLILDEVYGLCPKIKPPGQAKGYPSLPYWLARKRQRLESASEEMRLLYVAMTRARDFLILTGTVAEKTFEQDWAPDACGETAGLPAKRYADWVARWFGKHTAIASVDEGETDLVRWTICRDDPITGDKSDSAPDGEEAKLFSARAETWAALEKRLAFSYPHPEATREAAKTTVSAIYRQALEDLEDEAQPWTQLARIAASERSARVASSAVDRGSAHHQFQQLAAIERTATLQALNAEARRLVAEGAVTEEAVGLLDFESLHSFWTSELGNLARKRHKHVYRELPFTARFSPAELASLSGGITSPSLADEFIVVQGIVDMLIVTPEGLVLIDFKTDAVSANELAEKSRLYAPQLQLYAMAIERIYEKPVRGCWLYFLSAREAVPVGYRGIVPTLIEV